MATCLFQIEDLNDPEVKHGFQIISTSKSFRLEARCVDHMTWSHDTNLNHMTVT